MIWLPLLLLLSCLPAKPVRFISPYPPGGVVDIASRLVGNKLSEMWKQQVIVENRTGGGGTIGADHAAKSTPDGYTVLFATVSEFCITPHLSESWGSRRGLKMTESWLIST